mmetsp:Transcript_11753/g.21387  ORF Transcript_11753/g.21387 Transcript_11753/m.21387 type:complete len:335 (+) Transcript_11753:50-1054(+)
MLTRLGVWRPRAWSIVMVPTALAALLLICQTSTFSSAAPEEQIWMAERPSFTDMVSFPSWSRSSREVFQRHLGRCALVGSGSAMNGSRFGEEIDAHDTVIRVNRLPTESFFADFGQRTTILFGGKYLERQSEVDLMGSGTADCASRLGPCDLEALVIKGPLSSEGRSASICIFNTIMRWQKAHDQLPTCWSTWPLAWKNARMAVGVQREALASAVLQFPVWQRTHKEQTYMDLLMRGPKDFGLRISTGFFAFLTFVPLCDTMNLYGFRSGDPQRPDSTSDGHKATANHGGFLIEHALLHKLVNGTARREDYPSTAMGTWLMEQLKAKSGRIMLK